MSTPQTPENPALSEAIDECVDALRRGESIEDCLSRHPDMAEELRPLLVTISAAAGIAPERDDATRRIGHLRFEGAVRHHLATRQGRPASSRLSIRDWWTGRASRWSRAWAVGLATMALFLVLSTGAAYASTDAMPDSPLYPVKRATEHARLAVTFSDGSRAIYHLELIERRTLELAAVAESGDAARIEELSKDVLKNIEFARVEAGYTPSDATAQAEAAQEMGESASALKMETAPTLTQATMEDAPSTPEIPQAAMDAEQRAYLEAERAAAAHAHAMLQIAHQLAPPEGRQYVIRALAIAEQRYRQAHSPISLTLFAQGIARIRDGEMTLGGGLPLVLARQTLVNRAPRDGDFLTVGGYVRGEDGTLVVLQLYATEAEGVEENEIWLQAEMLPGSRGELIFIPGFNVTPSNEAEVSQSANEAGAWVYVHGTVTEAEAVTGEEIRLLGGTPIRFPEP